MHPHIVDTLFLIAAGSFLTAAIVSLLTIAAQVLRHLGKATKQFLWGLFVASGAAPLAETKRYVVADTTYRGPIRWVVLHLVGWMDYRGERMPWPDEMSALEYFQYHEEFMRFWAQKRLRYLEVQPSWLPKWTLEVTDQEANELRRHCPDEVAIANL